MIKNSSYIWCGELSNTTIDRKLVMWLIWWVIDNDNWSKTSHVFDVASYRLLELIENWSCVWYGELLITWFDRKLVMCLPWRVIDYVSWSKSHHVVDMASYWLRDLIENLSYIWCGELLNTRMYRKLVMCLIWQINDYVI